MSKLLAHTMRTYANGDGTSCRPSVVTLTRGMSVNRRTVQRHLRELLAHGYIKEIRAGGGMRSGGHRGRPTEYQLVMPSFPPAGTAAESRSSRAADSPENGGAESKEQRHTVSETAAQGRPTTTGTTPVTTPVTTLAVREEVSRSLRWAKFRDALRDTTGVLDDDPRLDEATTKIVNAPITAKVADDDIPVAVEEAAQALANRWDKGDVNPKTLARQWPGALRDAISERERQKELKGWLAWAVGEAAGK